METNSVPRICLESVVLDHKMVGKFSISLVERIFKVCSYCSEDFAQYGEISHNAGHDYHNESSFIVDTWIPLTNEFFEFAPLMSTTEATLPRARKEFETVLRLAEALQNN